MLMFNDEAQYAASRINNTFMMLKEEGILSYVLEVRGKIDGKIMVRHLPNNDQSLETTSSLADFEFAPGCPGYVNSLQGETIYLVRKPVRRDWRQGLRYSQFSQISKSGIKGVSSNWFHLNVRKISDSIKETYVDFIKAIEIVEESGEPLAFSRNFAIDKGFSLRCREQKVGRIDGNGLIRLDNKFNFLREELTARVGNERFT
jgi:hypothetical protein